MIDSMIPYHPLNRVTPIHRAYAWNNVFPGTAWWLMQDGKAFKEVERDPVTSDNRPNILRTNFLVDVPEYSRIEGLVQSGKVARDAVPGTQGMNPEIYEKYRVLNSFFAQYGHKGLEYVRDQIIAQSGPIEYDDFANVKKTRDAILFFGKSYRNHIVADMVKHQSTDFLDFTGLRFTPPNNQDWEGMGFYSLPDMTKGEYASDSQALKSHAYVFSITEDFYFNDYQVNVVADHQRALNEEIDYALNKKVADPIKALAAGGTTDWDTLNASNVIHDTDPSLVITTDIATILKKERFNANRILTTWEVVNKMYSNSYISGGNTLSPKVEARDRPNLLTGIIRDIPKVPNVVLGYDDLIQEGVNHRYITYDFEAFVLGLGPRRIAAVTDPITGTKTNAVRYWCGFKIWDWGTAADLYFKRTVT